MQWRFLAFFLVYCLLFSLLASTDLLTGPRRLLAGYETAVPRNFRGLNWLGDLHYIFLPPAPPVADRNHAFDLWRTYVAAMARVIH